MPSAQHLRQCPTATADGVCAVGDCLRTAPSRKGRRCRTLTNITILGSLESSVAFGIIIYDQDRRIVAIDEEAALLLGGKSHELIARKITDFVPQPDHAQLAEARATFERYGEASGHYAIEREDGSIVSNDYSVRANAPLPGLNLMAVAPSKNEGGAARVRVRRVGKDVFAGRETNYEEQWAGTGALSGRNGSVPACTQSAGELIGAVFATEHDGWAALKTIQWRFAQVTVALSWFDGGWPRDLRSVLAVRGGIGHLDDVTAIVSELGGSFMAGNTG